MTYKIESLFPSSILTCNINRAFTEEECKVIDYHSNHTLLNDGLNYYSKNTKILDKELPEIRKIIEHYISIYADNILCVRDDIHFYITQSWINYTSKNQNHIPHRHPNSILSGVLYFKAEEGTDKIKFYKDDWDSKEIMIIPKTYNYHNSYTWWLPVKTGDLVIFPSSLLHSVPTVTTDTTRISIAFNVFARGILGDSSFLTELRL